MGNYHVLFFAYLFPCEIKRASITEKADSFPDCVMDVAEAKLGAVLSADMK